MAENEGVQAIERPLHQHLLAIIPMRDLQDFASVCVQE